MRTYKFNVKCASGEMKEFTCQAASYNEARGLLADFAKNN
jgi:hypothetical protein